MLLNNQPYDYDERLGTEYYFLKHLEQIGGFPEDISLRYIVDDDDNEDEIDNQIVYLIELALDNRGKIGYNILVNQLNTEQKLTETDLTMDFFSRLIAQGEAYQWRKEGQQ